MPKFRNEKGTRGVFSFMCPACKKIHQIWTVDEGDGNPVWRFNNDFNKPTVEPSVSCRTPLVDRIDICHFFITDGMIKYLSDCTHDKAGQTHELPEL